MGLALLGGDPVTPSSAAEDPSVVDVFFFIEKFLRMDVIVITEA
jgi:hypothetical protein